MLKIRIYNKNLAQTLHRMGQIASMEFFSYLSMHRWLNWDAFREFYDKLVAGNVVDYPP